MEDDKIIPRTPFAFFWSVTKPHLKWAILAITMVVLASALSQSTSYFFKLIIDAVQAGDSERALMWGLLFPVAVLIVQLLFRGSGFAAAHWTNYAYKTGYDNVLGYILHHSHSYYVDRFAGSITNKVRNVVGTIEETIPDFLWAHLHAFVSFVVTFVLMASVDVRSGLVFLVLVIVLIVSNRFFAKQKTILSRENAEAGTALQGRLADVLSNVSTVRQYVRYAHESSVLAELTENKRNAGIANWLYTERILLMNSFILFAFSLSIFWILVSQWEKGVITTGDFVLVLALVSQITGTLLFIGRAFNATARTIGELREGLDDLMVPFDISDADTVKPLVVSRGEISWKNVNFEFDSNQVFSDFSLTILPGERIGLVGSSGAGKTTFVSLLLRQHEIQGGSINIDGQNISGVTQDSLRSQIAVVPQEPMLFHRTIRENIAYGKPEATDEEISAVAVKAQAHDFISALPNGYDTLVGERGVKLSGGQKQRIAIARAMLKNAPILILDEATSALDSESEVAIQKALHELMVGKTVVAIAHRLSTLREMDRIIVLESGKIIEDGTHDKLTTAGGLYQRLWEHQAGGFVTE